ncbi:TonB family protein [Larkinella insperata]|uniref:TonB family protein n=1 Tax=Larkinella insperata TaxID=332158 RepID=A0ABW3QDY4_9BACT|nr:TonB family protein [Larkinella insperata]
MNPSKPFSARLRFCQRRLDNRLISYTFGPKPSAFVTPFFEPSTLKQRILMLQKSETSRWAVFKYGFATLLIASLFVFVAACEDQSKKEITSQEPITISGEILSSDGKPIPGAEILLKGAQTGTTTDAKGQYRFRVPANGTLLVSFVGHKSVEIPVAGSTRINARLALATEGQESSFSGKKGETDKSGDALAPQVTDDGKGPIFSVVEKLPEFPGGMQGLTRFINDNLQYPEAAKRAYVSGKVFVSFVINTDGSFQDIQVMKGVGFGTDEETVRLIKSMPRWKPALNDGKAVRVRYNLPIKFQLE